MPLRVLKLLAFAEKTARGEICAPVVPVDLLMLSRPTVPAPFYLALAAGSGLCAAGEPCRKRTGTEWSERGEAPNDVKGARRLHLTLQVVSIANARSAHRGHNLASKRHGDRSTSEADNDDCADACPAAARQRGERQLGQLGFGRVSRIIFGSEKRRYRKQSCMAAAEALASLGCLRCG